MPLVYERSLAGAYQRFSHPGRSAALVNAQNELAFRKRRVKDLQLDDEQDPLADRWRHEIGRLRGAPRRFGCRSSQMSTSIEPQIEAPQSWLATKEKPHPVCANRAPQVRLLPGTVRARTYRATRRRKPRRSGARAEMI
jgi:hypothetical protein